MLEVFIVLSLSIGFFITFMPNAAKALVSKRKPAPKTIEPSMPKFKTQTAGQIYQRYVALPPEFAQFPELADALHALDDLTEAKRAVVEGAIVHEFNCVRAYENHWSAYTMRRELRQVRSIQRCAACTPYREYEDAVWALEKARDDRNQAIAEAEAARKIDSASASLIHYGDLVERMRAEAKIHEDVTNQFFTE